MNNPHSMNEILKRVGSNNFTSPDQYMAPAVMEVFNILIDRIEALERHHEQDEFYYNRVVE